MKPKELTIRGLVLGALITTIFTAANVYLGLKVGLTFASSIPAAVISMAILSFVKDSSILENNIVQTVASAAGTLSAIIFVLPGLVIVGWWTGFPFWQSFLICLSGGVLGVLFTIPLRRALVTNSDLPYPEGVAAAEVLKVVLARAGNKADSGKREKDSLPSSSAGCLFWARLLTRRVSLRSVTVFFRLGTSGSWVLHRFLTRFRCGSSLGFRRMAMLTGLESLGDRGADLTYMQPAGGVLHPLYSGIWRHRAVHRSRQFDARH